MRRMNAAEAIPKSFKFGSLTFRVFKTRDGRLGFRYKEGSEWKQSIRKSVGALREDAERVALGLLNAEAAAIDVTAEDRRIYIAARKALAPLAIDVDRAVRMLVEAAELAGGVERVTEACRWFNRSQPNLLSATTSEAATQFSRHLSSSGVSRIYAQKMDQDLAKFTARFPGEIGACRAGDIDDWLRGLPIGLRRRRNLLGKLVTLFNFARDRGFLPDNLRSEAEKIERPKIQRRAPSIYSPQELDLLLMQCHQPPDRRAGRNDYRGFLPALAIGAFAGLRWSEISSLDWQSHIHWEERVISVGDENKTGHRQVPILDNLLSWLAPWRGAIGKVCPYPRPDNIIRRLGMRAGLPVGDRRYANALRHSYVSYRMAITKNAPLVSEECGHSITELKKSYLRRQLEPAAKRWFSIGPADSGNVVQMPLLSLGRTT